MSKYGKLPAMVAEEILWIKTIGRSNRSYGFKKSQYTLTQKGKK